jgi:hypothetical protein
MDYQFIVLGIKNLERSQMLDKLAKLLPINYQLDAQIIIYSYHITFHVRQKRPEEHKPWATIKARDLQTPQ